MTMDIIQWYAIAMAAFTLLLLFLLWLSSRLHCYPRPEAQTQPRGQYHSRRSHHYQQSHLVKLRRFYNRFYIWILRHLIYALCVQRRYWTSITWIQALLMFIYVIGNGVCMGLEVQDLSQLMIRSGSIASVNIIFLFLGGRRNFVAGRIGLPLHVYYLAHHLVGRMVVLQGILHAVLAIIVDQPLKFDTRTISGITVSALSRI